jgi:hypothetical protein
VGVQKNRVVYFFQRASHRENIVAEYAVLLHYKFQERFDPEIQYLIEFERIGCWD